MNADERRELMGNYVRVWRREHGCRPVEGPTVAASLVQAATLLAIARIASARRSGGVA